MVRRIVREEILKAFTDFGKCAEDGVGYDTGEIETTALYAVSRTAEWSVERMKRNEQ